MSGDQRMHDWSFAKYQTCWQIQVRACRPRDAYWSSCTSLLRVLASDTSGRRSRTCPSQQHLLKALSINHARAHWKPYVSRGQELSFTALGDAAAEGQTGRHIDHAAQNGDSPNSCPTMAVAGQPLWRTVDRSTMAWVRKVTIEASSRYVS